MAELPHSVSDYVLVLLQKGASGVLELDGRYYVVVAGRVIEVTTKRRWARRTLRQETR